MKLNRLIALLACFTVPLHAAERLVPAPEPLQVGGVTQAHQAISIPDVAYGDLDELWLKGGTDGQVAYIEDSTSGLVTPYRFAFYSSSPPGLAIAITAHTGWYWVPVEPPGRNVVLTKTADYTVTYADMGATVSTVGAGAQVILQLPDAVVGASIGVRVGAAFAVRLEPLSTDTISLPSTGVPEAAGDYIVADAAGETCFLKCYVADTWSVVSYTGTWTGQ